MPSELVEESLSAELAALGFPGAAPNRRRFFDGSSAAAHRPWLICAPLWALALGACGGGRPPATAITLKATNTLGFDIFVPNDARQGGLTVGHGGAGSFASVPEAPTCACERCERACDDSCACSTTPMAHRIRAGQSFSRTFDGTEHAATRADCGAGDLGPVCFDSGQPAPAGTYALRFCFATNVPGASDGTDNFATTFDGSALTCITRNFQYPTDTEWDISPDPPTPCGPANACPAGQLCQQGVCSASCLANGVPPLGASWLVAVSVITDQAFFTTSGATLRGAGTVGTVSFSQGVLDLRLSRSEGMGAAVGELYAQLPRTLTALPLQLGQAVTVEVVPMDASDPHSASGLVIRDAAGDLLLAAELDTGAPVLTADDLAPFAVSGQGTPMACDQVPICGRNLHSTVRFSAGAASVDAEPGATVSLAVGGRTWDATAVANSQLPSSAPSEVCGPAHEFGYVIVAHVGS